jgi:predicted anti-sigma-YlaC factor YlaD
MTAPIDDFPCNLVVEVLTEYLEGAMAPQDARRLEEHLGICSGCASVLEQFNVVIQLTGRLSERDVEALSAEEREPLMAAFRAWHAAQ